MIKKENDRYYIHSHKTEKKIGRNDGYPTATEAVYALLGMTSKGAFYTKPSHVKRRMIVSYKKRHGIE